MACILVIIPKIYKTKQGMRTENWGEIERRPFE